MIKVIRNHLHAPRERKQKKKKMIFYFFYSANEENGKFFGKIENWNVHWILKMLLFLCCFNIDFIFIYGIPFTRLKLEIFLIEMYNWKCTFWAFCNNNNNNKKSSNNWNWIWKTIEIFRHQTYNVWKTEINSEKESVKNRSAYFSWLIHW